MRGVNVLFIIALAMVVQRSDVLYVGGQTVAPTDGVTVVTEGPTSSPTRKPTVEPSVSPTSSPTKKPTKNPTNEPTRSPTKQPTKNPTGKPTSSPTKQPTREPTSSPTKQPTRQPTSSPTKQPTSKPTSGPTKQPTSKPTGSPTKQPTKTPTKNPTTKSPTRNPTTKSPTKNPTRTPTRNPTKNPTKMPTRNPTTRSPTGGPTKNPTTPSPTKQPTRNPTRNPTTSSPTGGAGEPTEAPTGAPTSLVEPKPIRGTGEICGETNEFVPYPEMNGFGAASYFFASLIIVAGVGGAAFVTIFREKPIMRLSQKWFMFAFSIGTAFIGASLIPLIHGVFYPSSQACLAHDWLFNLSLSFSLVILLVKELRVWTVFRKTKKMRRVKLPNRRLFLYSAGLMIPVWLLLIINTAFGDSEPNPCTLYRCDNNTVASYLLYAYNIILTGATIVIAILARKVPSVAGESMGIVFTGCFTAFALFVLGFFFYLNVASPDVENLVYAFSVLWCALFALGFIVFRKGFWFSKSKSEITSIFLGSHASDDTDYYTRTTENHPGGAQQFYYDSTHQATGSTSTSTAENNIRPKSLDYLPTVLEPNTDDNNDDDNSSDNNNNTQAVLGETRQYDLEDQAELTSMQATAQKKRELAFKIGEHGSWEEFVDRQSGDSFWIHKSNFQITSECPYGNSTTLTHI